MLRHRGRAAHAHAHPGVPRRPARHGDHRRRRGAQRPAAAGQAARRGAAGHLGRRRGGAGLRRSAGLDGTAATERDADRHQGRGPQRPGGHAAQHGPLRARDERRNAPRRAGRRRHLPRPVGAARAEARVAAPARAEAVHPGAGQPGSRDHAGPGARGPPGCHHRHRPVRLSEPGQQRAVFPVHLPRRAGCLRHHDQRGDEDRRGRGDRRAGPRRGLRGRRRGLWRRRPGVRPRLHHPQAVRSPPDPRGCPRRRPGRDGQRRRPPRHRRLRRLSPQPGTLRLPLRPAHAVGVRGGAQIAQAHRLQRRHRRARAARGADPGG